MISDTPEFENSASDKHFGRLLDTGIFDFVGVGGCVRWWVIVFGSKGVDIVTIVGMLSPANVHLFSVRVVKLVIRLDRPLDIDPRGVSTTESIVERDFEDGWVEVVVQRWCCKRLFSFDNLTNGEECRTIDRPSK
ncbi:hypothetical protein C448_05958 [Halococcus morrhuae DSM 1307]|uniref:Uncharacterized protein n=1 Tax=Halococcus morrhuae DSM 1307 TaxID=931277 RepID=M0MMN5_HALMO|nr:hypothetical protein [Halococcus morrhuae]EMA46623.1 hypothetical protein C448_05958 [Halococcus morrhuae DSM 1307]